MSKRVQLEYLKAQGEVIPELEDLVGLPPAIEYLWEWFNNISKRRQRTAFGDMLPLTHTEIWSWSQLTRFRLAPWELETMFDLDTVFLSEMAKEK